MKKLLVWGAVVLGVLFILLAIYYWITPAESLPAFMPGYDPTIAVPHFKHGLAALIVGVALFIFAWFYSGPAKKVSGQQ